MRGNCQNFSPSFEVYVDAEFGDTLINAVFTLDQGRELLLWQSELNQLREKLAVKDSVINSNIAYIQDLEQKVSEYDSTTAEYDVVIDLKNTEVNALRETIDLQNRQIKRQRRGKIFGIISGMLIGAGLGGAAVAIFN